MQPCKFVVLACHHHRAYHVMVYIPLLMPQLAEERRMRAEAESALHEHGDAIEQMAQELQHSRCV